MSKYIKYCRKCVMPQTKPDLFIDEKGICSACSYYESRQEINWDLRREKLEEILDKYRSKKRNNYDCIVPVSGGKDSHFQTIKMLELGMNPLCVTSTTDMLSDLGRQNIENLKKLGVDYIEVSVNPLVRKKINKITLTEIGDISWSEHIAIFTFPIHIAVKFGVPLIIWGENSQNEYGGPADAANNHVLNRRWLEEFGGLLGLRVSDIEGKYGIENKHLIMYNYPSDEDLKRVGVTGLFLGHFLPWDGYRNALIAQAHGFRTYPKNVEGSLANYENLDNFQTGIHDYFKFLKYGFGRSTDIACSHIRRGRLERSEAIELVKKIDGSFPWKYLGCSLETILKEINVSLDEFIKICDRFTNKKIFKCDSSGKFIKDRNGNLSKINYDNIKDE